MADNNSKSGIVHFRVAEGAGKLLMEIAQEHLFYTLDPIKAVKTIEESLSGCPKDLVIKILKGDMVITVVTENDEDFFNVVDRDENIHSDYPVLDIVEWYKRKYKEIGENGAYLHRTLGQIAENIAKNDKNLTIDINLDSILRFLTGDNKTVIDEISNNVEVQEIQDIIKLCNDYLIQTRKVWDVMDFLIKTYPEFFNPIDKSVDNWLDTNKHIVVDMVSRRLQNFISTNIELIRNEIKDADTDIKEFIEDSLKVDVTPSTGIVPVNIMDNYSAGWLAPNGDFYGMNGPISLNLHNQIADALQEIGIIPIDDELDYNSDSWLAQTGWVRVHGKSIQFEGCLNNRLSKKIVDLTPIQIKKIYEYGQLCCGGSLLMGWRRSAISAARFQMDSENLVRLYKTYFDF